MTEVLVNLLIIHQLHMLQMNCDFPGCDTPCSAATDTDISECQPWRCKQHVFQSHQFAPKKLQTVAVSYPRWLQPETLNAVKACIYIYICTAWSIALYGTETWTLRAVDQKHLGTPDTHEGSACNEAYCAHWKSGNVYSSISQLFFHVGTHTIIFPILRNPYLQICEQAEKQKSAQRLLQYCQLPDKNSCDTSSYIYTYIHGIFHGI
jgi:hypothetical protein